MPERKVVVEWKKLVDNNYGSFCGESDYGVYQITGSHHVFGDNSLLYIGKAQEQNFKTRLSQHQKWLKKEWGLRIYVEKIHSIDEQAENEYHGNLWRSTMPDLEALLIYFHSPPYNSKYISEYPSPKNMLRIINIGDYGSLYPEISHFGIEQYDMKSIACLED